MTTNREKKLLVREKYNRIIDEMIEKANLDMSIAVFIIALCSIGGASLFWFGYLHNDSLLIQTLFIVGPLFLIASGISCQIRRGKGRAYQYIFIFLICLFVAFCDMMSGYRIRLAMCIPILLSMRYFNKKTLIYSYITSTLFLLGSFFASAYLYQETGFIDLDTVYIDGQTMVSSGQLSDIITKGKFQSETLLYNGILRQFLPLVFILGLITLFCVVIMEYNINLINKIEESQQNEADNKMKISQLQTKIMLSQIQPHFLFNSLSSIAFLCGTDPAKAKKTTVTFTKYLRANVDSLTSDNLIDIDKEIDHTKAYLEIEKVRFADRLNYELDIQSNHFLVPPLSLQPIVENAVKHGICKKEEGSGTVKLSTFSDEDNDYIVVKDDGVGFDVEKVFNEKDNHVGLFNVIDRLEKLCNGKVIINSELGIGTEIKIILPKEE